MSNGARNVLPRWTLRTSSSPSGRILHLGAIVVATKVFASNVAQYFHVGDRGAATALFGWRDEIVLGDGGKIALNVKYLQEAMACIETKQVAISYTTANAPAVLRPVGGGSDYLHLIMPMRIP